MVKNAPIFVRTPPPGVGKRKMIQRSVEKHGQSRIKVEKALLFPLSKLDLQNVKFLYCNVNVSLDNWLSDLDYEQLKRVSIQFPDPWFKRKHFKRRVLKTSLLNSIARYMSKDGELFIQSDIFKLIESMSNTIDESRYFNRKDEGGLRFINKNPYDVMTDREIFSLKKNLLIYRVMYIRNSLLFTN